MKEGDILTMTIDKIKETIFWYKNQHSIYNVPFKFE